MEFFQTKLPWLSRDWTLGRSLNYLTKLAVFVFVPGLHQITCNRKILGSLLFALFVVASFVVSNSPLDFFANEFGKVHPYVELPFIAQLISWVLLASDFGNLENRSLKPVNIIPASIVILMFFMPLHDRDFSYILVEQGNQTCPEFCINDIVQYELNSHRVGEIAVGKHVIVSLENVAVPNTSTKLGVAKILAGPRGKDCTEDETIENYLPYDAFCLSNYDFFPFDYVVLGKGQYTFPAKQKGNVNLIERTRIIGIQPVKIGNISEYQLVSDDNTAILGRTLLTIYKWTNINLFGFSSTSEKPKSISNAR